MINSISISTKGRRDYKIIMLIILLGPMINLYLLFRYANILMCVIGHNKLKIKYEQLCVIKWFIFDYSKFIEFNKYVKSVGLDFDDAFMRVNLYYV